MKLKSVLLAGLSEPILRGFENSWDVDVPIGPGNYRLRPGSPSIDAGTNAPGGPGIDFAGAPRPRDGDGDGIAVRDQGAFERPDTFAPKITGLKAPKLKRNAKRGLNTVVVKGGKLSEGRYRLKLTARDAFGNVSTRTIKAKAAARR